MAPSSAPLTFEEQQFVWQGVRDLKDIPYIQHQTQIVSLLASNLGRTDRVIRGFFQRHTRSYNLIGGPPPLPLGRPTGNSVTRAVVHGAPPTSPYPSPPRRLARTNPPSPTTSSRSTGTPTSRSASVHQLPASHHSSSAGTPRYPLRSRGAISPAPPLPRNAPRGRATHSEPRKKRRVFSHRATNPRLWALDPVPMSSLANVKQEDGHSVICFDI